EAAGDAEVVAVLREDPPSQGGGGGEGPGRLRERAEGGARPGQPGAPARQQQRTLGACEIPRPALYRGTGEVSGGGQRLGAAGAGVRGVHTARAQRVGHTVD